MVKRGAAGVVRLEVVDARQARIALQAGRREKRGPDVAREERVAPTAGGRAEAFDLVDGVHGEGTGPLQPALVTGPREQGEEGESVTAGAVA